MCKVISVISCKGGVGKTTSAVNISAYLQMQGKKFCVVDLDAQHNLSRHFGVWAIPSAETPTITELFRAAIDDCSDETMQQMIRDSICQTTTVDMIPSTVQLSSLEAVLSTATSRERVLEYILSFIKKDYDYIFLDCHPGLDLFLDQCTNRFGFGFDSCGSAHPEQRWAGTGRKDDPHCPTKN